MSGLQWSMAGLEVLALFSTGRRMHGYEVLKETGQHVSTTYTILHRMERIGLLGAEVERIDPKLSRRVPLVIYEMTTAGIDHFHAIRALFV